MSLSDLVLTTRQRERLEAAAATYEKQLDDAARAYLAERGLDRIAASARLGCVRDPLPGDERFTGRISIPYLTRAGVVAMKYRTITDEQPKYDGPKGQPTRLFNTTAITENTSGVIVICEGEFDALVMHHAVGLPAVGVPGVSAWKAHHPRMFADFERVYVVTDNDVKDDGLNPGQQLAEKVCAMLPDAVAVPPPAGMDVNDWFLAVGAAGIRAALGAENA